MKLEDLSPEERIKLKKQLFEEDKLEKQKIKDNKEAFKSLTKGFVLENIDGLIKHKGILTDCVNKLFEDYEVIKELKQQVYGANDQDSHTSTLQDGSASITIGHNVSIGFNGNESSGVKKIQEYIKTLATDDENTQKLSKIVDVYLKPTRKTKMLNPSNIIQLNSLRKEFNAKEFDEGMDIIIESQIRQQTSMYVSGWKFVPGENSRKVKMEFRFTV